MNKVMLCYPPGKLYQRGEDRSQGNVENATATSVRACNDLGYVASDLQRHNFKVFLKDYQTEGLHFEALQEDFSNFAPDIFFMSITNATIFEDLAVVRELKLINPECTVILKGALFFAPEESMLRQLDLDDVDYLIGGESDFIVARLAQAHFNDKSQLPGIRGILYRDGQKWCGTDFSSWEEQLDQFPFPDRTLMNNELYVRPDTKEKQATIATSRGCAASCIYCLTPKISGKKVRFRSPQNIFDELRDCYFSHNIRNFFFKSDTFTINKKWVTELCELILSSELYGKIEWVANSRTKPLDKETLQLMKDAGCWLVAFGFESGSPETLRRIKKGATLDDNYKAAQYAKEVGLQVYGFYLVGFPWEEESHLNATKKMIYEINADFIEIHLAIPYYGTPLYDEAKESLLIKDSVLGRDYFNPPTIGTKHLTINELINYKRKLLLSYHLRPRYIIKKITYALRNPGVLKSYFSFGFKLIKQNLLVKTS